MKYAHKLQNSIAEVGRWITENAEELATTIDGQLETKITIVFDGSGEEVSPTIKIEKDFISIKATEKLMG